jgi:hypothetical protein
MRISLSDPRLSQAERRFLRDVAEKLRPPYHLATARRLNKHLEIAAKATEIAAAYHASTRGSLAPQGT